MTDYMEMTEAFEQARTAPDALERAFGLEEEVRAGGVAAVRERLQGHGAEFCADCDVEIPDARRKAYPSAVCCVDCQSLREGRAQ
ncbi:TraR/DksA family transcriptional regulator [Pseudidiomarina sp.]|uniref:TraR/DksA family transcriptional regulator n=1 Tax=Pseudidiomarina sp. TaxID=2081707 RepID=UPI003A986016